MMARRLLTGPRLIGALVILALVAASFFALRTPPVPVEIGTVSRGPMVVSVNDLGETRVSDLYVVSAPVTGQLLRVPLKPGASVVPDTTVLARIRPVEPGPLDERSSRQAEATARSAAAELAAARSRAGEAAAMQRLAQRELSRIQSLFPRGFVSQAALDRARAERDRSAAELMAARNAERAAGENVEAARAALITSGGSGRGAVSVTSPVPGFVMRVPQESARVVAAGTPLVEIGDPARLEMVTDLLSADAVRVRPGASVVIEDWGGERPLRGRVRLVEPYGFTKFSALGVEEQRVNVVIDFVDPHAAWQRLGHGYRATVRIVTWSSPAVLRVPISALFRSANRWAVFAVDETGRARLTRLEIGRMNDEVAEVKSGLRAGERVILHAGEQVEHGARVRERTSR
jgi:HlyD family secretion protein